MRTLAILLLSLGISARVAAQEIEPSYSRDGSDYYSASVEAGETRSVPTACERLYGKHIEIQQVDKAWRCSVTTPSEPRLSAKLNEETALADQFPEPKRQKVVDTLIDKYKHLAQCPAGTEAFHDGTMYACAKSFTAKELCPSGSPQAVESGDIGCVITSCPKGATDLGSLTKGEHAGCFKCPKGSYDAKETEAFYGALKGMPSKFSDVICKAPASGKPKDGKAAPTKTP